MVTKVGLRISEVLLGGDDITIKSWFEIIVNILGLILPFGLRLSSTKLKLVSNHSLGSFQ